MAPRRPLRGARVCSRNIPPLETGTGLGATPGTWEEPGDRSWHGYLAPAGGASASARPGNWPAGGGEAGQGPSISYMEGPCLILPGRNALPTSAAPRQPPERQPR